MWNKPSDGRTVIYVVVAAVAGWFLGHNMGESKAAAAAQRQTPEAWEFCDTLAPLLLPDVAPEACKRAVEDTFSVRYESQSDRDYGD